MVETPDFAVGKDVRPEQRGQTALVLAREHAGPCGVGEHVLEHEGVDVDRACRMRSTAPPSPPSKALLLQARDNLQRMLAVVPLTDDERSAVDDGQEALDKLLCQLADVPTPAGAPHPSPDRRPGSRDAPAYHRRQAKPAATGQRSMTPPGTCAVAAE